MSCRWGNLAIAAAFLLSACTSASFSDASNPRNGSRAPSSISVHAMCDFSLGEGKGVLHLYTNWIHDRDNIQAGLKPPCQEETSYFLLKNKTPGQGSGASYGLPVGVVMDVVDDRASGGVAYCWGDELPLTLELTGGKTPTGGSKATGDAILKFKSGKEYSGGCYYSDL